MTKLVWDFITSLSDTTILTITIILGIIGITSVILIGKATIKYLEAFEELDNY